MDTAPDQAAPRDPHEISFMRDEVLEILDKQEKWWIARKTDGTEGSQYLPAILAILSGF